MRYMFLLLILSNCIGDSFTTESPSSNIPNMVSCVSYFENRRLKVCPISTQVNNDIIVCLKQENCDSCHEEMENWEQCETCLKINCYDLWEKCIGGACDY